MHKKLTILGFILVFGHAYVQAQDATIYFYRKAKFKGSLIYYKVYVDTTLMGKMDPGLMLVRSALPAPGASGPRQRAIKAFTSMLRLIKHIL